MNINPAQVQSMFLRHLLEVVIYNRIPWDAKLVRGYTGESLTGRLALDVSDGMPFYNPRPERHRRTLAELPAQDWSQHICEDGAWLDSAWDSWKHASFLDGPPGPPDLTPFGPGVWATAEGRDLNLSVDNQGAVAVGCDRWHTETIKLELHYPEEIVELLEFVSGTDPKLLGNPEWVSRPLASLLDGLFLLIPGLGSPELLPFTEQPCLASLPDDLRLALNAWLDGRWSTLEELSGLDWPGYMDCAGLCTGSFHGLEPARADDLLVAGRLDCYPSVHRVIPIGQCGFLAETYEEPAVVFRFRRDVSRLFLTDYLLHTRESKQVMQLFPAKVRSLPRRLEEIQVRLPAAKHDQIAFALELRRARLDYAREAVSILGATEPLETMAARYRQREHFLYERLGIDTLLLDSMWEYGHESFVSET